MIISYQADTFDTLGYGVIRYKPWEKDCALYVARDLQRTFYLPNNVDEDDDAVYFEIDDRHLFYGEIRSYFYKSIAKYNAEQKNEKVR